MNAMDGTHLSNSNTRFDWNERFSKEARSKPIPSLQSIVSKYAGIPGIIGMHGGLPPSAAFPFAAFDCTLGPPGSSSSSDSTDKTDKQQIPTDGQATADGSGPLQHISISDAALVASAQQYNFHVKGYPPLQAWALDFIHKSQQPATLKSSGSGQEPIGCEVVITSGSSAALDALTRVLLNPGDPILLEEYTYSHFVEAHVLPMGCELLAVRLDHEGLIPTHLDELLTSRQAAGLPLPRVLYTIPTGQNPTGSVMSPDRMAEVYRLAQKWDLVIIEDDAYYWLQYSNGPDNVPGLDLKPGFLSLDTDGRVIRVDTLAKLLGPGFRLGWLAAPPELALKVGLYLASSTVGASSLSQVMIHQLLDKWGHDGLDNFVRDLQRRYAHYAAVAAAAADEHLKGLAEWRPAKAGMFLWMRMLGDNADSVKLMEYGASEKVMIIPGHLASAAHLQAAAKQLKQQQQQQADSNSIRQQAEQKLQASETVVEHQSEACPFFRVSFASVQSEDALKEGFMRLGKALRRCRDDMES